MIAWLLTVNLAWDAVVVVGTLAVAAAVSVMGAVAVMAVVVVMVVVTGAAATAAGVSVGAGVAVGGSAEVGVKVGIRARGSLVGGTAVASGPAGPKIKPQPLRTKLSIKKAAMDSPRRYVS